MSSGELQPSAHLSTSAAPLHLPQTGYRDRAAVQRAIPHATAPAAGPVGETTISAERGSGAGVLLKLHIEGLPVGAEAGIAD